MTKQLLLTLFGMVFISACMFHPIVDTRAPDVAAATQTARAEAIPPVTIEPVLLPTTTPAPECVNAKANISASGERIYHLPGDANYNTVKIDKDGEAIYCTAAEAEAAGFRHAQR